jgi:DNA repair protein RadC
MLPNHYKIVNKGVRNCFGVYLYNRPQHYFAMENYPISTGTVHEMPVDEKPRERLQRYGSESLSEAELLAIILRTGIRGQNAVETSRKLIKELGGIHQLGRARWKEISKFPAIGLVKAITIETVFELGRRVAMTPTRDRTSLRSPEDVVALFGPRLRDERVEIFMVVFLNSAKYLIGHKIISRGGMTATVVEPGEVFKQAVLNDAHSIIVLHNHPSGNLKPSEADIRLTKRLIEAGKNIGIALEDHLIIAANDFVSFRAKGIVAFSI